MIGLKSDGTAEAISHNVTSKSLDISSWTDIVAVSAGQEHTVGLKADGTVVSVGSDLYVGADINSWSDIRIPTNTRDD